MKIALTSDIHLEFGDWYPVNPENADVLILGGDIMLANEVENALGDVNQIIEYRGHRFIEFLHNCKKEYKDVIYIMGNHEHYHGDFAVSSKILGEACEKAGVHFLDKDIVKIGDITFIGGTLWTDMNAQDPDTLSHIRGMMSDFRVISNSTTPVHFKDHNGKFQTRAGTFSPEDSVEEHEAMLKFIDESTAAAPSARFVVIGHHAPSKLSTKPQYKKDVLVNGAYSSNLNKFIQDRPQIKAWTHGHTHDQFDYMVGSTRVLCYPRGYVNHERESNDKDPYFAKVFEV